MPMLQCSTCHLLRNLTEKNEGMQLCPLEPYVNKKNYMLAYWFVDGEINRWSARNKIIEFRKAFSAISSCYESNY